jgi:tetratricopeptide (TPR) repeat protein
MRRYASILIHEATHGVVSEKGIPYDESHRERIERLCHAEEVRFLKHDHPEIAAAYPFDLEFYSRTWKYHVIMGVWNSLRRIWGVLPNAARAQLNLGIRHQKEGAWTDAIACFSRAIELDSNYAVAYSNRGHAYEQEGEFDLAIQDYTRAITLRPNSAVAYNNRGHVYYKKGDFNKALLDLAKVVQIDPKFALAYSNRAGTFKAMLKYDEAAADYARVIELCPEKYPAYNNLAWFWATRKSEEKRDGKKALEYAIKACEMSQWKNPSTIRTLAVAYAETGNFEEAAKWETVYLASPNLSSHSQKAGKYRLSLFQSGQPYRMEL